MLLNVDINGNTHVISAGLLNLAGSTKYVYGGVGIRILVKGLKEGETHRQLGAVACIQAHQGQCHRS